MDTSQHLANKIIQQGTESLIGIGVHPDDASEMAARHVIIYGDIADELGVSREIYFRRVLISMGESVEE